MLKVCLFVAFSTQLSRNFAPFSRSKIQWFQLYYFDVGPFLFLFAAKSDRSPDSSGDSKYFFV